MQLDNFQHLVNLASEPSSKSYSLERLLWVWDNANERYVEFYGRLRANLLFLFERNDARGDFSLNGVYILERFRIIDEPDTDAFISAENSNDRLYREQLYRFSLLFVDSGESVRLAVNSSFEKDEWLSALSKASTSHDLID